ncbi:uncharacterized protein LOC126199446 [Schistocerca nitens]|uniref:uncharacterized protein LOC126199446 n=1 Tax=Schistocerca nitens TaxID=7011 RepID=UPI002118DD0F|nr:uncharacterized protein LOC126199446 [Schistocerca nitens]
MPAHRAASALHAPAPAPTFGFTVRGRSANSFRAQPPNPAPTATRPAVCSGAGATHAAPSTQQPPMRLPVPGGAPDRLESLLTAASQCDRQTLFPTPPHSLHIPQPPFSKLSARLFEEPLSPVLGGARVCLLWIRLSAAGRQIWRGRHGVGGGGGEQRRRRRLCLRPPRRRSLTRPPPPPPPPPPAAAAPLIKDAAPAANQRSARVSAESNSRPRSSGATQPAGAPHLHSRQSPSLAALHASRRHRLA